MELLSHKTIKNAGALLALVLLGVYFFLDPAELPFPKCPSLLLTGWKCPGCGSQRALHQLLHGNIAEAWGFNSLFVAALPYVLFGMLLENTKWGEGHQAIRRQWYGRHATWVALTLIVVFAVARNIWDF